MVEYLMQRGLSIVFRNYHNRFGEIDIIAKDNGQLVFVEVKYRHNNAKGHPEEAVTAYKIRKICRTADFYLASRGNSINYSQIRFDVIAIEDQDIRWYKNAFDYMPM